MQNLFQPGQAVRVLDSMKFVPFFSKNPVTCIHGAAAWRGDLSAQGSVRVEGGFEGQMRISGELRVSSEGKVRGSVQAASLEIEQGAQFSGPVAIGGDPQTVPPRKRRS